MGVSYYDALLPACEPGVGLPGVVAGIRVPYRVLASVGVPAGRIVLAFVSDSARLSRMFAANSAPAPAGQRPDATLCALARPTRVYGLDGRWDQARWWSREQRSCSSSGLAPTGWPRYASGASDRALMPR